jgi:hypothetical protein
MWIKAVGLTANNIALEDDGMIKHRVLILISILLILAGLSAACGRSNEPAQSVEVEPTEQLVTTEAVSTTSDSGAATVDPAATVAPETGTYGQAVDVPIMDGNRNFQISRTGENISYIMDAVTMEDVYIFYQDNLTAANWIPGPNETAVGSRNLVTLARTNDQVDRITVTMQNNPIGEFVVITIVIVRAQ